MTTATPFTNEYNTGVHLAPKARIYKVECLKNGKIYVGQTIKTALARWNVHLQKLTTGTHPNKGLQEDFDKYGVPGFLVTTVEIVPRAHAQDYEAVWMVKLGSIFPKKGYNRIGISRIEAMAKDPARAELLKRITEDDVTGHLQTWMAKYHRPKRDRKTTSNDASRDMTKF